MLIETSVFFLPILSNKYPAIKPPSSDEIAVIDAIIKFNNSE